MRRGSSMGAWYQTPRTEQYRIVKEPRRAASAARHLRPGLPARAYPDGAARGSVEMIGLEPTTSALQRQRSPKLSYIPAVGAFPSRSAPRGPAGARFAPRGRELRRGDLVGLGRVELPTSSLSGTRSNQLSYKPAGTLSRSLPAPPPGGPSQTFRPGALRPAFHGFEDEIFVARDRVPTSQGRPEAQTLGFFSRPGAFRLRGRPSKSIP